jgi:hypothetical protein
MVHELGENRLANIHPSLSAIPMGCAPHRSDVSFQPKNFQIEKSSNHL